jgi:hypothetical protein
MQNEMELYTLAEVFPRTFFFASAITKARPARTYHSLRQILRERSSPQTRGSKRSSWLLAFKPSCFGCSSAAILASSNSGQQPRDENTNAVIRDSAHISKDQCPEPYLDSTRRFLISHHLFVASVVGATVTEQPFAS